MIMQRVTKYKIIHGFIFKKKREKKTKFGRPHRRWENNIKILLKEMVLRFELYLYDLEYGSVLVSFGQHEE
jgi:hypothetical protein